MKEIIKVFLKLGTFAFGGPAAHIAMMEEEIVRKRKWMSHEHFLDLIGATNLIPGPNSTEMAMHCGYEKGGWGGLVLAGVCFIFPAVVVTSFIAWFYQRYGEVPSVLPFLAGIKPAVIVIIVAAVKKLAKKAVKNYTMGMLGVFSLGACFLGVNEIVVLLATGVLGSAFMHIKRRYTNQKSSWLLIPLSLNGLVIKSMTTSSIFLTFLKVGAFLYGSGYVLFAYLDAELVTKGWMLRQDLVDAVAVGQITPGPVLSTATFVGFQLGGLKGAMAATIGIFLPSFVFVFFLNPLISKMRNSAVLRGFLDAVNVAAVAVMLAVTINMGITVLNSWQSFFILALSGFLTFGIKKPISTLWLIPVSSILGFLLYQIP